MAGDGRWTLPEQIVLVEAVQRCAPPRDSLAHQPHAFLKGDLDRGGHVTSPICLQLTRGGWDSFPLCVRRYATGILPDFNMVCKVVKLAMGYIGNSNPRETDFYTASECRECLLLLPWPSVEMGEGNGGREPSLLWRGRRVGMR